MEPQNKHILALSVDNESGTLGRVVGLFSGRGYNIHSLTVSEVDHENKRSRITITTHAPEHTIKHIITLLERLIPVHSVMDLSSSSSFIQRALLLAKVHAKQSDKDALLAMAKTFEAKLCDESEDTFMFELVADPVELDDFTKSLEPFGIIEMARTGITALSVGKNYL